MLNQLFSKKPKQLKKASQLPDNSYPIINLCDINIDICNAWLQAFSDTEDVNIYHGSIFKIHVDAIISPANSFGDMSGGIDKAIDDFFDQKAQSEIGRKIGWEFFGEIPVGAATVMKMERAAISHIIVAPTMRIPGLLPEGSINAYLAMRAALIAGIRFNEKKEKSITSISIPGLATGVGGMGFEESARQMRIAYNQVYLQAWKNVAHPAMAPFANR